ncbi:hypothetical protein GCM10017779_58780 [Streptomyces capillispiralis]|nr:hypothetical protein GCM10017779_58780 [Streptomyces capillispiralis]
MPVYPVPTVGRAMKERVDREFSAASRRRETVGGHQVARGCVYARSDQDGNGGPEASVRAQV